MSTNATVLRRWFRGLILEEEVPRRAGALGRAGPVGKPRIIDGDTLVIAGERVRLHGIDAPELDQTFVWRGRPIACGFMSLAALEALTAGVTLSCEAIERDPYGRLVAKCYSPSGVDVGARMVAAGWALAFRRYSLDYVAAEKAAKRARRGMWAGVFTTPWEWRLHQAKKSDASVVRADIRR